jgi:hypothetical protein
MTYNTLAQSLAGGDGSGFGAYNAPHRASDGALYLVTMSSTTAVSLRKSTDNGATWTSTTIYTAPQVIGDFTSVFTGDQLDIALLRAASTQTWHLIIPNVTTGSTPTVTEAQSILTAGQFLPRLASFSTDGTRDWLVVPGARGSIMGTSYDRIHVFTKLRSASTWPDSYNIGNSDVSSTADNYGYHDSVAAGGILHVVHLMNNTLRISTLSFIGNWSVSSRLTAVTASSPTRVSKPVVFGGNVYFWWNNNVYRFAHTSTNGVPAVELSLAGEHGGVSVIDNKLHAFVINGNNLTYRVLDGTWGASQTITGSLQSQTRVYGSRDGTTELVLAGSAGAGGSVFHSRLALGGGDPPPETRSASVVFNHTIGTTLTYTKQETQSEARSASVAFNHTVGTAFTYTKQVAVVKTESLTDDFTGPSINTTKWPTRIGEGTTMTITNDKLQIEHNAAYPRVSSGNLYQLQDSHIMVEVVPHTPHVTGNEVWVAYYHTIGSTSNFIAFYPRLDTSARIRSSVGGVQTDANVTYDRTNHRWLRIRESAGTLYFEGSPTGVAGTWTIMHQMTTPAWIIGHAAGGISLQIGNWSATNTTVSTFDSLNLPPAASEARSASVAFGLQSSVALDYTKFEETGGGTPATDVLYADNHISGTFSNPQNAVGNAPGTWAGDLNTNSNYTSRWSMDNPSGPLNSGGTQTVRVHVRRGGNSGVPTITVNLYQDGVFLAEVIPTTNVTSTTGEDLTGTFSHSLVTNRSGVEIEVVQTGAAGSGAVRNSAQLALIEWTADIITGSGEAPSHTLSWYLETDVAVDYTVDQPQPAYEWFTTWENGWDSVPWTGQQYQTQNAYKDTSGLGADPQTLRIAFTTAADNRWGANGFVHFNDLGVPLTSEKWFRHSTYYPANDPIFSTVNADKRNHRTWIIAGGNDVNALPAGGITTDITDHWQFRFNPHHDRNSYYQSANYPEGNTLYPVGKPWLMLYSYVHHANGETWGTHTNVVGGTRYGIELFLIDDLTNKLVAIEPDAWIDFAVRVVMNTPGQNNGIVHVFYNKGSGWRACRPFTDVRFSSNDTTLPSITGMSCIVSGGDGGNTVPYNFDIHFQRSAVSEQPLTGDWDPYGQVTDKSASVSFNHTVGTSLTYTKQEQEVKSASLSFDMTAAVAQTVTKQASSTAVINNVTSSEIVYSIAENMFATVSFSHTVGTEASAAKATTQVVVFNHVTSTDMARAVNTGVSFTFNTVTSTLLAGSKHTSSTATFGMESQLTSVYTIAESVFADFVFNLSTDVDSAGGKQVSRAASVGLESNVTVQYASSSLVGTSFTFSLLADTAAVVSKHLSPAVAFNTTVDSTVFYTSADVVSTSLFFNMIEDTYVDGSKAVDTVTEFDMYVGLQKVTSSSSSGAATFVFSMYGGVEATYTVDKQHSSDFGLDGGVGFDGAKQSDLTAQFNHTADLELGVVRGHQIDIEFNLGDSVAFDAGSAKSGSVVYNIVSEMEQDSSKTTPAGFVFTNDVNYSFDYSTGSGAMLHFTMFAGADVNGSKDALVETQYNMSHTINVGYYTVGASYAEDIAMSVTTTYITSLDVQPTRNLVITYGPARDTRFTVVQLRQNMQTDWTRNRIVTYGPAREVGFTTIQAIENLGETPARWVRYDYNPAER